MQANYPKKQSPTYWDTVHINYPVTKFPETGFSSETISRHWRPPPEVIPTLKTHLKEENEYSRDYNVTLDLLRSQTNLDYGYKIPETVRFDKHNTCNDNLYIYPPSKKLADRVPAEKVHGTTEMKSSYTEPVTACRLVTDKDQFKHPSSLSLELPEVEPFRKEIEPLDTTHEGYEKYLDPYLTTSKLHHRPFTADVLNRPSNSKDILTYYTYSNTPWVRSKKPNIQEWRLPVSKPKSIYDREKFKDGFREIRTHNKLNWIPRAFHTETRDNYVKPPSWPESEIHNYEEEVRSHYQRSIAGLQANTEHQLSAINHLYTTENSHVGSRRPVCSMIDQYFEKNKRYGWIESRTTYDLGNSLIFHEVSDNYQKPYQT